MRICKSVSGQSVELRKANHTELTASCIAAKTCHWPYIKLIWESPATQDKKFPPSQTVLPFKTRIKWSQGWTQPQVFRRYFFQLLQYWMLRPSFSSHRAVLMTKTDLTFPAFSLRFVEFAAQFSFRCKFSFHEERRSSQVWQWRDFPQPITIFCYA